MPLLRRTARDFDALMDAMVARIPEMAPAWTNLNEGEFGTFLVRLLAASGDMLSFYLDKLAAEAFLPTAVLRESVEKLAALIDYQPSRAVAAKTLLRFSLPSPALVDLVVPRYTQARTADGLVFTTREDKTIYAGQASVEVDAYQGEFVSDVFTSAGGAVQDYLLSQPNVAANFLDVTVGTTVWTEDRAGTSPAMTALYNLLVDTTERGTLHFSKYLGEVPAQNSTIQASYVATAGALGNVGAFLVTTLLSRVVGGDTLSVTNPVVASGGKDRETLDETRVNAPRQLRLGGRVVTLQDYVDALETFPKVAKAQAINHAGYVECYVAPDDGATFFVPAPVSTATGVTAVGAALPTDTYYVAVTAVDAFGETAAWEYAPGTRARLDRVQAVTLSGGQNAVQLVTTVPAGAVGLRLYIGTAPTTLRLQATTPVTVAAGTPQTLSIGTLPLSTAAGLPQVNTTGARAQSGADSLRSALEGMLEERRQLVSQFALFNPTYVPVNLTLTAQIAPNREKTQMDGALRSALAALFAFDQQTFGSAVTLSSLYATLMAVPGVLSVLVQNPSTDLALAVGEIATLGVVTLTLSGGVG